MQKEKTVKEAWNESFDESISKQAYNTSPVEAIVRNAAYYFRDRFEDGDLSSLKFLEMGCGAGPNLIWLAKRGVNVSGVDISTTALDLCRSNFSQSGLSNKLVDLKESSVCDVPFEDESFDGIFEACVFQHLKKK